MSKRPKIPATRIQIEYDRIIPLPIRSKEALLDSLRRTKLSMEDLQEALGDVGDVRDVRDVDPTGNFVKFDDWFAPRAEFALSILNALRKDSEVQIPVEYDIRSNVCTKWVVAAVVDFCVQQTRHQVPLPLRHRTIDPVRDASGELIGATIGGGKALFWTDSTSKKASKRKAFAAVVGFPFGGQQLYLFAVPPHDPIVRALQVEYK